MFSKKNYDGYKEVLEGISFKTTTWGNKASMSEFRLKKGSNIPLHQHPHEQTGYLISGKMNFTIGDELFSAGPGDSWNIPSNVEHGVEVLEDTVVVEVFSPVREDYLP